MKSVVLSLGSNLADRRSFIERAGRELSQRVGNIVRASSVRESESWGFSSHPFLNQVVEVQTALSPEEVLQVTQQIEQDLGRTEKSGRDAQGNPIYHDRTIDIDILLYGRLQLSSDVLTLPHPLMQERDFVRIPLADIISDELAAWWTSLR